uniref:Leucine-rich repeat flightless-interacting protein 2 n=1 Tax=Schistosoma mansoni TaxID=6183 RepID=A0A5K4F4D7_SCHMA
MASRHVPYTDMSDMGRAAQETEIQRAANQQLIEEGRVIKHKELEKMRREEENKDDSSSERPDVIIKVNNGSTSRLSSQRSSADLASSISSRNLDARELRAQLLQLEEKVKGAMLSNVQLDNDKQLLKYEVDLLKDKLEDLTDAYASLNKTFLENKRELAYQKMQIVELTHRLDYARHQVEARDQLIVEHGLVLIGGTNADDNSTLSNMEELTTTNTLISSTNKGKSTSNNSNLVMMNGLSNDNNNHSKSNSLIHQNGDKSSNHLPEMVLITKSTAELLNTLSETTLDKQIQQLFSMRSELDARVEELESQLREERKRFEAPATRYDSKNRTNIAITEDIKHELQQSRNQAQEYKLKFHESCQKISALESDIVRLEGQTKRYKAIADACEEQEEILKQDRRRCQRELRDVQSKLEDLKAENARLQRVVDKYNRGSVIPGTGSSIRQAHDSSVNR